MTEFINKDFVFISLGNDLHNILTQTQAHIGNTEKAVQVRAVPPLAIAVATRCSNEALIGSSLGPMWPHLFKIAAQGAGKQWKHRLGFFSAASPTS